MLAVFAGDLSVLLGLAILFLPLVVTELSQPRDSFWGALIILLGLVLVNCNDRFLGSPMLAVIFGSLVIGRLGFEVSQSRWQKLSIQEKKHLQSTEKWLTRIKELSFVFFKLGSILIELFNVFKPKSKSISLKNKKWVRPDSKNEPPPLIELQENLNNEKKIQINSDDEQNSSSINAKITPEDT